MEYQKNKNTFDEWSMTLDKILGSITALEEEISIIK